MKKVMLSMMLLCAAMVVCGEQRVAPITVKQTEPNFEQMRKQTANQAEYRNALVALQSQLNKEESELKAVEPVIKAERKAYKTTKKSLQAERKALKKQLKKCGKDEPCKDETRNKVETLKTKFVDLGLFDYDIDAKQQQLKEMLNRNEQVQKAVKAEIKKIQL